MNFRDRLYRGYWTSSAKHADLKPGAFDYDARVYRKRLGPWLPATRDAAVFELGCGTGSFLNYLRQEGYRSAWGLDRDAESVATARRLGIPGAEVGDGVEHLRAQSERYDCIVALDVLEHFTKEEVLGVVDAVFAALKPGGVFLWRAPNADGPFAGRIRYGDLTHELAFTRSSAWQLMKTCGFELVEVVGEEPVVTGVRSLARAALWKGFSAAARLYLFAESYAQDALLTPNLLVRAQKR